MMIKKVCGKCGGEIEADRLAILDTPLCAKCAAQEPGNILQQANKITTMRKGSVLMWPCENTIDKAQIAEALTFATDRIRRAYALCRWKPSTEKPAGWDLWFVDLSPETQNLYQCLYWWLMGYGDRMSVEQKAVKL